MSYIVIKSIKGRQYRYQQRTYREGGRVKTESIYLGPVAGSPRRKGILAGIGDLVRSNFPRRNGLPDEETMLRQYNAKVERENQARNNLLADLHAQFGLTLGGVVPAEPAPEPRQQDAPSADTDGAEGQ